MTLAGPVIGVLLAGGAARRFGGHKLLARLADGEAVGLAAARTLATAVARVLVVVRADDEPTAELFRAAGYEVVESAAAARGMAHSLAAGVVASPEAAAWMVALADMPRVAPATLAVLLRTWQAQDSIVVPLYGARRGHPVIFPARYAAELRALQGDHGARALLAAHADDVVTLETADPGVLADIDTPDDLARLATGDAQASRSTSPMGRGTPTA